MKRKIHFPSLEGLNTVHENRAGSIVLLSYNDNSKHVFPCRHTSCKNRMYLCPAELVENARSLHCLASTTNVDNVILFDMTGQYKGTGHRVAAQCPVCTFYALLCMRPACALCNRELKPGDRVFLLGDKAVKTKHTADDTVLPAAAMRVRLKVGGKYLCCDSSVCGLLRRPKDAWSVFDPRCLAPPALSVKRKKLAEQGPSDVEPEIRGASQVLESSFDD